MSLGLCLVNSVFRYEETSGPPGPNTGQGNHFSLTQRPLAASLVPLDTVAAILELLYCWALGKLRIGVSFSLTLFYFLNFHQSKITQKISD